jgi:hypothetical protein
MDGYYRIDMSDVAQVANILKLCSTAEASLEHGHKFG